MARIVVLNGVSSAGKSSIAKSIQAQSATDWLHISLDQFISMIPVGRETAAEWFEVEKIGQADQPPEVSITNGPRGARLMQAMREFVAAAANRQLDLIVDDVCTATEIEDYRLRLDGHHLTIVRVDVPLVTAERRERARGDRMIGLARKQARRIHSDIGYDLTVCNDDGMLNACASDILALVASTD